MKYILSEFKKIDNHIVEAMKFGIKFSFKISIFAIIILFTYMFFYSSPSVFYIGISLFKSSLFFIATSIICGFAFQKIKMDLKE